MIWIAVAAGLALAAGIVWWRLRRRNRHRLISLVALTREPVEFDPAVLARLAGKAWKADLGDGDSEGPDGFVAAAGVVNTIVHGDRMFLINCLPGPYVDDPDAAAGGITDLRIAALFREHTAWFSCDALGVDRSTSEKEVRDWYRRLGRLMAELLDENCLLIYLPDSELAYPINEDTEAALRSQDPVGSLQETLTVPIIEVSSDDPRLRKAVETARREWPKFLVAYEGGAGENFSVKGPVSHSGNTEFIWITVTAVEGDVIYGELANDPGDLGPLKLGSNVTLPVADLNDWCFVDPDGNVVGGFSVEAVRKASRRRRESGSD
jgi:uncharacterized protein YegJ (DUF2314 family)